MCDNRHMCDNRQMCDNRHRCVTTGPGYCLDGFDRIIGFLNKRNLILNIGKINNHSFNESLYFLADENNKIVNYL